VDISETAPIAEILRSWKKLDL